MYSVMKKILAWIIKIWDRLTGAELRREVERLEKELHVARGENITASVEQDRRVRFELRADLKTKIRVWWRENKTKRFDELENELSGIVKEIETAKKELEQLRPAPVDHGERFLDFTPKVEHRGLSKTGRRRV